MLRVVSGCRPREIVEAGLVEMSSCRMVLKGQV